MQFKKLVSVLALMGLSGITGFWIGEQKLKIAIKNWKPAVVVNQSPAPTVSSDVDFSLFWTVWEKVSDLYVDKSALDSKKMVDGAISGMVASLGDPYTVYLPVQQNKEAKEDLGGAFEGVGIQLGFDENNRLAVVTPLEGTPADKAGVKSGDLILRIVDEQKKVDTATDGMALPEAVKIIRGVGGTKVKLTMYREGADKPYDVELTRETIVVKSVTVEYKEYKGKKVAWLKLTRFGDRTREEWNEKVNEIISRQDEITGVVLDVRNNPGGYLEMAVFTAAEFLPVGKTVVTQQYGDGSGMENKVERNGRLLKTPLTVLVNKGSASASEILAGALQDHGRAQVVGEQSFGKGSVQQPEDFADGSGVHVTVAKWLRPSGEWLDKKGVKPDFEVKPLEAEEGQIVDDVQLNKAIEELK